MMMDVVAQRGSNIAPCLSGLADDSIPAADVANLNSRAEMFCPYVDFAMARVDIGYRWKRSCQVAMGRSMTAILSRIHRD